jgi:hypothetical protein
MKKSEWGPCIWKTLHVLTVKIKDEHFDIQRSRLIETITNICNNLPCPLCSSHAKSLLRKYKVEHVKTKDSLIYIIIKLHNDVNKRLRKPIQEASVMKEYYKTLNTREIIQDYYNKNINMRFGEKMMMHSFHRKMFLTKFKSYIRTNIEYFDE